MAVGSVAAAIGFDFETIADLRLALDELCNACAAGATSSSVLSLICHWNEAGLYVDCSVSFIGRCAHSEDRGRRPSTWSQPARALRQHPRRPRGRLRDSGDRAWLSTRMVAQERLRVADGLMMRGAKRAR